MGEPKIISDPEIVPGPKIIPQPVSVEDYHSDDEPSTASRNKMYAHASSKQPSSRAPQVKAIIPDDHSVDSGYSSKTGATVNSVELPIRSDRRKEKAPHAAVKKVKDERTRSSSLSPIKQSSKSASAPKFKPEIAQPAQLGSQAALLPRHLPPAPTSCPPGCQCGRSPASAGPLPAGYPYTAPPHPRPAGPYQYHFPLPSPGGAPPPSYHVPGAVPQIGPPRPRGHSNATYEPSHRGSYHEAYGGHYPPNPPAPLPPRAYAPQYPALDYPAPRPLQPDPYLRDYPAYDQRPAPGPPPLDRHPVNSQPMRPGPPPPQRRSSAMVEYMYGPRGSATAAPMADSRWAPPPSPSEFRREPLERERDREMMPPPPRPATMLPPRRESFRRPLSRTERPLTMHDETFYEPYEEAYDDDFDDFDDEVAAPVMSQRLRRTSSARHAPAPRPRPEPYRSDIHHSTSAIPRAVNFERPRGPRYSTYGPDEPPEKHQISDAERYMGERRGESGTHRLPLTPENLNGRSALPSDTGRPRMRTPSHSQSGTGSGDSREERQSDNININYGGRTIEIIPERDGREHAIIIGGSKKKYHQPGSEQSGRSRDSRKSVTRSNAEGHRRRRSSVLNARTWEGYN